MGFYIIHLLLLFIWILGPKFFFKKDPMTDVQNGRAKDQRRAYMVDFLYLVNEYLSKQYKGLPFHILIQPLMEKE